MPINSSKIQMKTITYVGTGAALLAVIGYFILRFKKSHRIPSSDSQRKKYSDNELRIQDNENLTHDKNLNLNEEQLKDNFELMMNSNAKDQNLSNFEHHIEDKIDFNNNRLPSYSSNDFTSTILSNSCNEQDINTNYVKNDRITKMQHVNYTQDESKVSNLVLYFFHYTLNSMKRMFSVRNIHTYYIHRIFKKKRSLSSFYLILAAIF